jgi:hypothetical protein
MNLDVRRRTTPAVLVHDDGAQVFVPIDGADIPDRIDHDGHTYEFVGLRFGIARFEMARWR